MAIKIKWEEYPSVRPGGKRTFFVGRIKKGKVSVVWDRIEEMWDLSLNDKTIAYFKTSTKARKLAETL